MEFHHFSQAGLELLTSGDPPELASPNAEITGVSHLAQFIPFTLKHLWDIHGGGGSVSKPLSSKSALHIF